MKNSQLKIEPGTTQLRCQKCYRLHDLKYIVINGFTSIGYQCFSHKKSVLGVYYLAKFNMQKGLRLPFTELSGHIKQLQDGWFEISPLKEKSTAIQGMMEFI
jgi:hypothetical protein